jgi:hypothetical protein
MGTSDLDLRSVILLTQSSRVRFSAMMKVSNLLCSHREGGDGSGSYVSPKPSKAASGLHVQEEAVRGNETGRQQSFADSCKTARCRNCFGKNRPCSFRCACKGACGNSKPVPVPEAFQGRSRAEMESTTLQDLVSQLTPRDIELWAVKHGKFGHYWLQFKLCSVEGSEDCWYCSRVQQRIFPKLSYFQIMPEPNGEGGWTSLAERVRMVEEGERDIESFLSNASLPSHKIKEAWVDDPHLTEERAKLLAEKSNLSVPTIQGLFEKLNAPFERPLASFEQLASVEGDKD